MYVENISFCEPSSAVFLNADAFHDNCTHQESFGLDLRQGFQCVMIVAMVCRYIHETARPAPLRAVFFWPKRWKNKLHPSDPIRTYQYCWLVVWNHGILWLAILIYWECHHPNWLKTPWFFGVGWNHQPVMDHDLFSIWDVILPTNSSMFHGEIAMAWRLNSWYRSLCFRWLGGSWNKVDTMDT